MTMELPPSWRALLGGELEKDYFRDLTRLLEVERARTSVFPPEDEVFAAFALTSFADLKVLMLGQDPYHDDGQAHGLCFSVKPPQKPPPSLKNIFKELRDDLGIETPAAVGDLRPWAQQGVLLLNAVLTVVAHHPNSHKNKGWETFTDAVIARVNAREAPAVFCLWGAYARKKAKLVDASRHVVIEGAHPSPLSMKKFFGSKPFSCINRALQSQGIAPIDWQLRVQT